MVHGADSPYEVCKSDEDLFLEKEERVGAAVKIQALQRGITAREKVRGMRVDQERWNAMVRAASAKTVSGPCMIRSAAHSHMSCNTCHVLNCNYCCANRSSE